MWVGPGGFYRAASPVLAAANVSMYYEDMSRHRLQVQIPLRLAAQIGKAARRHRVTNSEWIRRAIESALILDRNRTDALDRLSRLAAPTGDVDQMLAEIAAGR